MFEYFSGLYSGLVNDIIGKKTKPKKYTADDKKELMTSVVRLISDARIGVLKASVLSAQDAGVNDLWGNLNDISGLLYKMEVEVSVEEASLLSASALKTALSCLYRTLEDIVKALCNTQRLSPQTHPSTFSSVSEKLENAGAGIAHAIVALQDYSATLTKKKELGRFDDVTVNSARRAVFLATCVMVNMCGPYSTSPASYPNFGAMAAAIESAVAISKLISPNTPSFMRTRAAEIAVRKFNAVRNNCHDYVVRANDSGTTDVSEIFVDVPTIFINLVSKYTDPDFAKSFVKEEASEGIPDLKEILLLEGMFYASYAVFLCDTSKQLKSSIKDEERTEISDHMKTLLDSSYGCYHAYQTVRSTTNRPLSDMSADTLIQGLHRIVDVAGELGKQHERVLPANVKHFINTIAICAHRNLDMLSKSESSYSCIWSKSVLPLFPNELPETLKEKHVKGSTGDNSRVYCLISDKKIRSKLSERTLAENQLVYADLKFSKQATSWRGGKKPRSHLTRRDSSTDEQKTLYTDVNISKVGGYNNPSPIYDTVTPEPYLARGR